MLPRGFAGASPGDLANGTLWVSEVAGPTGREVALRGDVRQGTTTSVETGTLGRSVRMVS